jgi:hypothetical protein
LGVDVLENNTAAHKCVQFAITIHFPETTGVSKVFPPPTLPIENEISLTALAAAGEEALCNEASSSDMSRTAK